MREGAREVGTRKVDIRHSLLKFILLIPACKQRAPVHKIHLPFLCPEYEDSLV